MILQKIVEYYFSSFRGIAREIWILAAVLLITRSGMMVLPFLTLYTTKDLSFSIVEAGIVTGCYGAGSLLGSWLGGWLTDRVGFYRVTLYSLLVGGIGMISLTLFRDFYSLSIAVFITSLIVDASRPPIMAAVSSYSKPEDQTRSISLIRMAVNLGIAIGPAIAGLLAATAGYFWLFIIDGLTCMAATIPLIVFIKGDQRIVDKKNKETKDTDIPAYRDHLYLTFLVIFCINIIAFMQILSTAPLFFERELQMNEAQIGLFFTFNGMLVFFFEMPLVKFSQENLKSFTSIILGAVLMGLGHLCLNLNLHWLIIITAYNLFISFGEIINFPFGNSLSLDRAPKSQKGKYMGLWAMMFSTAFIIAPVLGTQLVDNFGFKTTWFAIAALNFLMIPGFIWVKQHWFETEGKESVIEL